MANVHLSLREGWIVPEGPRDNSPAQNRQAIINHPSQDEKELHIRDSI